MRCHPSNEDLLKELDRQGLNKPFQRGSRIKAKWGISRYPLRIVSGEQARAVRGVQDLYSSEIDAYLAQQSNDERVMERDLELEYFMKRIQAVDSIITAYQEVLGDENCEAPTKRARKKADAHTCADEILGYSKDGSYVMLLDNRELHKKNDFTRLIEAEDWCIPYQLPVGDMLWSYCCSQVNINRATGVVAPLTKYYLTGLIIERKTPRDLSNSIVDERYKAQIQRLRNFAADPGLLNLPIKHNDGTRSVRSLVIILIEKNGPVDPTVVNVKAVETAIIKFQCRDGFYVMYSSGNAHSAQLLRSIHGRIGHEPRRPPTQNTVSLTVEADAPTIGDSRLSLEPPGGSKRLTIGTSSSIYAKSAGVTAHDIFRKQLRMIPNIQPVDAEYLLAEFPTFHTLLHAMQQSQLKICTRRAEVGISVKAHQSLTAYLGVTARSKSFSPPHRLPTL